MESYSVQAVLSAVDKNFSKTFQSANKTANSFGNNTAKSTRVGGNSMIKFGAVAGAAMAVVSKALSVVTSNIGNAVDRFDTLNKYPVVMKALGYSAKDTGKSMKLLSNGIDGLPTSLNEITSAAQQFAPLTGSATSGAKAALALNDAFLASGASVSDTSRGMRQYTQMLATGKVDMQSWRTLQETMPIALRKTAKAFGFTGKSAEQDLFKALQSGEITIDDLNKKFVELDKGQNGFATLARKNSVGIKTSFTNLGTAVTKGLAGMLTAIDNGLKNAKLGGIADLINSMKGGINTAFDAINSAVAKYVPVIVKAIKSMVDFVKSNASWITPLVIGIGTFVAAMKTMMTIISIVSAVGKAYTALKTAMVIGQAVAGVISGSQAAASALTFMAGESKLAALALKLLGGAFPGMIIIAAITAVVAALVWFFTQTKTGQAIWQSFVTFLSNAWTTISTTATAVWTGIATFFTSIWSGIVSVVTTVWTTISTFLTTIWTAISTAATTIWTAIATVLSTIWGSIVTTATTIWNGLSTFFSNLWTGISAIISGAWEIIKSIVLGAILIVLDFVTGNFTALKSDISLIWNSIKDGLSSIWNGIKSVASTVYNAIKNVIVNIWNSIKSVTSSIWNSIKNLISSTWNGIKSVVSSVVNSIRSVVTSAWNSIKSVTSSAWNGIKSVISSGINAARSVVSSAVNSMRSAASSAWNAMKSAASSVVSGIKSAFKSLSSISLSGAGRAIMNSFLGGLQSTWGKVKSFVGGIASWIRKHKGPISYDRKLLIPAGNAIMNGLNSGLVDNFKTVQKNVKNMGSAISDSMNSQFQLTDVFGSINTSLNNSSLNGVMEHELNVANNWTVEVPVNLDGREVARVTAKPMQNELNRMETQNNRIHGQR